MRLFCFLAFLFLIQNSNAQSYAEKEMQSFSEIYFDLKSPVHEEDAVTALLAQFPEITEERYAQLLRNAFKVESNNLTPKEKEFIQILKQSNLAEKAKSKSRLLSLCAVHGMSPTTYAEMLSQYKTDIAFQRSLQPYFQKVIQEKNEK